MSALCLLALPARRAAAAPLQVQQLPLEVPQAFEQAAQGQGPAVKVKQERPAARQERPPKLPHLKIKVCNVGFASHTAWANGFAAASVQHDVDVLTVKPDRWKWRMQCGAVEFASQVRIPDAPRPRPRPRPRAHKHPQANARPPTQTKPRLGVLRSAPSR